MYKKEDLEAGVLGDGKYVFVPTAFRYRGKGHLAYDMIILHGLYSLALSFQLTPPQGGWWAFKENPYNAQIMPRQANWTGKDMWLNKPLDRSGLQLLTIHPVPLFL